MRASPATAASGRDELLYGRRELFEAYNKGLSLLPTAELPWYRLTSLVNAPRVIPENAEVAAEVLERIWREGPLSTLDFERGEKVDWLWAATNVVRAVLEAFSVAGVLGLARRDGNRRYYDLAERLFPAELLERDEPARDRLRHKLLSRFRAHGLLGNAGTGEVWLGTGYARGRSELREELIDEGEIVPVAVEGIRGPRYVLREEVELLDGLPLGGLRPRSEAPLGLLRPGDPVRRPLRRPHRAASRRADPRAVVGGRLRPSPRRGSRGGDAGVPRVRRRRPPRVGPAPPL